MSELPNPKISRRKLLGGVAGAAAAVPVLHELVPHQGAHDQLARAQGKGGHGDHGAGGSAAPSHPGHAGAAHSGMRGSVDPAVNGFDPREILRDFDYGKVKRANGRHGARVGDRRRRHARSRSRPGSSSRPGPTTAASPARRCARREGDRIRIHFVNGSSHPHTMHFHGIHAARMDGIPQVGAGQRSSPVASFVYEFDAEPFGLHLYHCHASPLAEHIAKGLYGAFIIDPKAGPAGRRRAW